MKLQETVLRPSEMLLSSTRLHWHDHNTSSPGGTVWGSQLIRAVELGRCSAALWRACEGLAAAGRMHQHMKTTSSMTYHSRGQEKWKIRRKEAKEADIS